MPKTSNDPSLLDSVKEAIDKDVSNGSYEEFAKVYIDLIEVFEKKDRVLELILYAASKAKHTTDKYFSYFRCFCVSCKCDNYLFKTLSIFAENENFALMDWMYENLYHIRLFITKPGSNGIMFSAIENDKVNVLQWFYKNVKKSEEDRVMISEYPNILSNELLYIKIIDRIRFLCQSDTPMGVAVKAKAKESIKWLIRQGVEVSDELLRSNQWLGEFILREVNSEEVNLVVDKCALEEQVGTTDDPVMEVENKYKTTESSTQHNVSREMPQPDEKIDFFDVLPDCCVLHILNFLDVKSKKQAGMLSRRFRGLYKFGPNVISLFQSYRKVIDEGNFTGLYLDSLLEVVERDWIIVGLLLYVASKIKDKNDKYFGCFKLLISRSNNYRCSFVILSIFAEKENFALMDWLYDNDDYIRSCITEKNRVVREIICMFIKSNKVEVLKWFRKHAQSVDRCLPYYGERYGFVGPQESSALHDVSQWFLEEDVMTPLGNRPR